MKNSRLTHSVNFDWRALGVFRTSHCGTLLAQRRDPQVPNLIVDFPESRILKSAGRRELCFETGNIGQRAIRFCAWQFSEDAMNISDFRNAMADHRQIVSGADGEANRFFEPVLVQDRAHVEIVRHDQTIEAKFPTQQFRDDASINWRESFCAQNTDTSRCKSSCYRFFRRIAETPRVLHDRVLRVCVRSSVIRSARHSW